MKIQNLWNPFSFSLYSCYWGDSSLSEIKQKDGRNALMRVFRGMVGFKNQLQVPYKKDCDHLFFLGYA